MTPRLLFSFLLAAAVVLLALPLAHAARTPVAVGFEVYFLDLRLIDSRNVLFEVNVEVRYTWKNESVTPGSSLSNVWLPAVQQTNLVKREVKYPDVLLAGDGFIQLRTREVSKYSFAFQFKEFPFDQQEPHIVLEPAYQVGDHYVRLFSEQTQAGTMSTMIQHKGEFTIEGWEDFRNPSVFEMVSTNGVGDEVVISVVGFEASRIYNSFIVQQIVPATIFVMYSWAGFFIDITSVMPRLMPIMFAVVNLANINASLATIIPRSSDTTWIEVFALVSVLFATLVVLELLVVHNFARHGYRELAKGTDAIARVLYPGVYFSIFFFFIIEMAADEPLWGALLWLFGSLALVFIAVGIVLAFRILHVIARRKAKGTE